MRNCWLYVVRCMGRLMGLKGSEGILLNDRIDCCWLGNWCRSVVFRCESTSTGGESGAVDKGMGRVASEVGSCALKK